MGAYVMFLGANPVFWHSNKQRAIACSSTEAKYRALASVVAELQWIKSLIDELWLSLHQTHILYSDNLGVTYLCVNLVFHTRMKYLVIDYHFVCDLVQSSAIRVVHVFARDQLADALTKSIPWPKLLARSM